MPALHNLHTLYLHDGHHHDHHHHHRHHLNGDDDDGCLWCPHCANIIHFIFIMVIIVIIILMVMKLMTMMMVKAERFATVLVGLTEYWSNWNQTPQNLKWNQYLVRKCHLSMWPKATSYILAPAQKSYSVHSQETCISSCDIFLNYTETSILCVAVTIPPRGDHWGGFSFHNSLNQPFVVTSFGNWSQMALADQVFAFVVSL